MTDIRRARDVLAKWRKGATEDRWVPRLTNSVLDSLAEGERVVSFAGYSDADLIVGTAGNPALWDALDGMLAAEQEAQKPHRAPNRYAERIASAIITADERMSA